MKRAIVILAVMMAALPLTRTAMAASYQVSISSFAFTPHGRHIIVGDTIIWRNLDSVPHTSTSDNGLWSSPNLSTNQTYMHIFTGSGVFPYHCAIHVSMKDTIFVETQSGTGDSPPATPQDLNCRQIIQTRSMRRLLSNTRFPRQPMLISKSLTFSVRKLTL